MLQSPFKKSTYINQVIFTSLSQEYLNACNFTCCTVSSAQIEICCVSLDAIEIAGSVRNKFKDLEDQYFRFGHAFPVNAMATVALTFIFCEGPLALTDSL